MRAGRKKLGYNLSISYTNVFGEKYFNQIEITRVPVTSGNAVMRHHILSAACDLIKLLSSQQNHITSK